ncbi:hypothetical protein DOS84_17045 [Flavobacterium aquariorum]|uniref:DUF4890 domain-containing protein n=1 Tax=Flavobacterium aquariorum TaxID=2217670 RepID=A0A2W7U4W6_9FLAO|nr:hypothetical protein [Flavobacterium aquariorum]PZX92239.1 hypothetical protein DOS84_17045 [Flavobacterium aquariorum]
MKILIIALVFGMGLTGFAQETTTKQNRAGMEKMTPEQRQQKHLAYLTKELTLDAKQQEAVGKILAEKGTKVQDLKVQKDTRKASESKMTSEERATLKNKMEAEKTDTEAKMKAILSADQYQKWITLREENKEKMRGKSEAMGGAPMEKMTPEQRQQKHLTYLTKELTLDAKQQEAVGKILAEKGAKAQDLKAKKESRRSSGEKMTDAEREAFKTQMQAEKADTEAKMKAILSANQYQKWLTIREENKEKMKGKMKERRNGGM